MPANANGSRGGGTGTYQSPMQRMGIGRTGIANATERAKRFGGTAVQDCSSATASGGDTDSHAHREGGAKEKEAEAGKGGETGKRMGNEEREGTTRTGDGIVSELEPPPSKMTAALKNVRLTVTPGELVAIVGPVGSGKSSILAGLLDQMDVERGGGGVTLNGEVRMVLQNAPPSLPPSSVHACTPYPPHITRHTSPVHPFTRSPVHPPTRTRSSRSPIH